MPGPADEAGLADPDERDDPFGHGKHKRRKEQPLGERGTGGEPDEPPDADCVAFAVIDGLQRLQGDADPVEEDGQPDDAERHGGDRQHRRPPAVDQVFGDDEKKQGVEQPGGRVAEAELERAGEIARQELGREADAAGRAVEKTRQEDGDADQVGAPRAERDSAHAQRRQPPGAAAEPIRQRDVQDDLRAVGRKAAPRAAVRVDEIEEQHVDGFQKDDGGIPFPVFAEKLRRRRVWRHEGEIRPLQQRSGHPEKPAQNKRRHKSLPGEIRGTGLLHARHRVRVGNGRSLGEEPREEADTRKSRHQQIHRLQRIFAQHHPGDDGIGQDEHVFCNDHNRRGSEETKKFSICKCHGYLSGQRGIYVGRQGRRRCSSGIFIAIRITIGRASRTFRQSPHGRSRALSARRVSSEAPAAAPSAGSCPSSSEPAGHGR